MHDMHEQMLKKQAVTPLKTAIGFTISVLSIVVLVLLIVLELQWIKHWGRLLKTRMP